MTNFRELCDELLDELKYQTDWSIAEELKERASAALAEPEPEPEWPTDEELDELFIEIDQSGEPESWRAYARAVLARWGK